MYDLEFTHTVNWGIRKVSHHVYQGVVYCKEKQKDVTAVYWPLLKIKWLYMFISDWERKIILCTNPFFPVMLCYINYLALTSLTSRIWVIQSSGKLQVIHG